MESTLHKRRTLGDLLHQLGGVSADRVRLIPLPGTATEQDAINNPLCKRVIRASGNRGCQFRTGKRTRIHSGRVGSDVTED
jgi:hypothetical protein